MARCGGPLEDGTGTMDAGLSAPFEGESPGVRLFAPGTDVAARYEVLSVRGVGGSAVVYAAFDRELRQPVALKVLRADRTSAAALTRFRREAAVARQAASPRLVRVFDIEATGESVFLTMEDVPGGSLKDRLSDGPLPLEEALRIAGEVLEGLAVLHGLGIVHRDVKPGNVLLAADGSVKLADFGLSRRLLADETRATSMDAVVGTIEYVSPEQALGRELDGRSDLYSFGITLFELLTGGVPFRRDSAIGTALSHVKDPPPRLRSVRPDAPAWLEAYVARLLEKDPEGRYSRAQDALADLGARRATGSPTRPRRRRLLVAAALVIASLGIAATLAGPSLVRKPVAVRITETGRNGHGIVAVDAKGLALWERPDVWTSRHATFFRREDGTTGIAALVSDADGRFGSGIAPIAFLERETGATLATQNVDIPVGLREVAARRRWGALALNAVDVDGTGGEELVLVLVDPESYPSIAFLVEPGAGAASVVFAPSGHHHPVGSADVDGDGRRELLFVGCANRLGNHVGVAAVRVPGRNGDGSPVEASGELPALTPDQPSFEHSERRLAWYALGPPSRSSAGRSVSTDAERGTLRLEGFSSSPFELAFDGFGPGAASALVGRPRAEARERTWRLLRAASRLADAEDLAGACETAARAEETIRPAGDPWLLLWARRTRARLLVASGQVEAGSALYRQVADASPEVGAVALDAAHALHLHGRLTEALVWYDLAVFGRGAREEEWLVDEAIQSGTMALLEREDFGGAMSRVERATLDPTMKTELADVVSWAAGRRVPSRTGPGYGTPLRRYWRLEERFAAGGEETARLRGEAEAEASQADETQELFGLLVGEILLREGKAPEAWDRVGPAFSSLWARRSRDVVARGHLRLAGDRAARAAEAAGRRGEAARIRSDVRRFLAAAR